MSERNIGDALEDFGDAAALLDMQQELLDPREQKIYAEVRRTFVGLQWQVRSADDARKQEIAEDVSSLFIVISAFYERVRNLLRRRRESASSGSVDAQDGAGS